MGRQRTIRMARRAAPADEQIDHRRLAREIASQCGWTVGARFEFAALARRALPAWYTPAALAKVLGPSPVYLHDGYGRPAALVALPCDIRGRDDGSNILALAVYLNLPLAVQPPWGHAAPNGRIVVFRRSVVDLWPHR